MIGKGLLNRTPQEVDRILLAAMPDAERIGAMLAVQEDLRRSSEHLEKVMARLAASPVSANRRKRARAAANAAKHAHHWIDVAQKALDIVAERGLNWDEALNLAREAAWLAAWHTGFASALNAEVSGSHRPGSRTALLVSILKAQPDLPVARANAQLPVPIDDATARRVARKLRGPRRNP